MLLRDGWNSISVKQRFEFQRKFRKAAALLRTNILLAVYTRTHGIVIVKCSLELSYNIFILTRLLSRTADIPNSFEPFSDRNLLNNPYDIGNKFTNVWSIKTFSYISCTSHTILSRHAWFVDNFYSRIPVETEPSRGHLPFADAPQRQASDSRGYGAFLWLIINSNYIPFQWRAVAPLPVSQTGKFIQTWPVQISHYQNVAKYGLPNRFGRYLTMYPIFRIGTYFCRQNIPQGCY